MISGRNILCIANPSWYGNYAKTTVELMKVLGKTNRVLYVNPPHTIKVLTDAIRGKEKLPLKTILGLKKRVTKATDTKGDIYVLRPPMNLTINFLPKGKLYNTLLRYNSWLVRKSIKKALRQLNMQDGLINFISLNPWLGLENANKLNEALLIYHCYDEVAGARWLGKHGPYLEKELMRKADAVIVTSQGLYDAKKNLAKKCFLVRNAVNALLYSKGFHEEMHGKKIIGYIGSIDRRLDYKMLQYLVNELSDFEFVFIGRSRGDNEGIALLRHFKNVKFEGAKNVHELPDYLQTFSMGIIPFQMNDYNKNIYPLKINEYLAAGLPVVTTNFSFLDDFKNTVSIARNKEEFKKYILEELKNDTVEKKYYRKKVAFSNSWENRGEEISDVINKLEVEK